MWAAFAVAMVIAMPVMPAAMGGLPYLIQATGQALAGAPAWIGALLTDGLLPGSAWHWPSRVSCSACS